MFDNKRSDKLSSAGYDAWKNAIGNKRTSFGIHDESKSHNSSMNKAISLSEISQGDAPNIQQCVIKAGFIHFQTSKIQGHFQDKYTF
jgi:hypothetical protein